MVISHAKGAPLCDAFLVARLISSFIPRSTFLGCRFNCQKQGNGSRMITRLMLIFQLTLTLLEESLTTTTTTRNLLA